MKKEDLQNSQQGTGSAENKGAGREQQKSQTTNVSHNQQNDIAQEAGLGRHRMTDIEGLEEMSGRDDYAGSNNDDLSNEELNASNDQ